MSSANRQRRAQNRQARRLASQAAQERAKRQRLTIAGVAMLVAIVVAVVLVAKAHSGANRASPPTTTTPTTAGPTTTAVQSAAGKPCVAERGKASGGAPVVPVRVGPPPTKLIVRDLQPGTGPVVKPAQTITADYIGVACSTGAVFASSYASGAPQTFPLANTIAGWKQGIPGMKVGGERLLGIPPALAYQSQSRDLIAPNQTLWFVVHVRSAK